MSDFIQSLIEEKERIERLLKIAEDRENYFQSKLVSSYKYSHGSLRGVEDVSDLKDFLEENKEWVLMMMNWKEVL